MTEEPEDDLEFQRAAIAGAFRDGWRSPQDGRTRVLTERAYAEARMLLGRGGWTGLDQATIQAVRDGAQPGDSLPPLPPLPFITDVTGAEVVITGTGSGRRIAVLFPMSISPAFVSGTGSAVSPAGKLSSGSGSRKRLRPEHCTG